MFQLAGPCPSLFVWANYIRQFPRKLVWAIRNPLVISIRVQMGLEWVFQKLVKWKVNGSKRVTPRKILQKEYKGSSEKRQEETQLKKYINYEETEIQRQLRERYIYKEREKEKEEKWKISQLQNCAKVSLKRSTWIHPWWSRIANYLLKRS